MTLSLEALKLPVQCIIQMQSIWILHADMTNLVQLRHLIALADMGSFTHAARAMNRSQPAFSRSIAELERDLGVALIDRSNHGNELTFIGRAVLERARQVVFEANELSQCVTDHVQGRAGHFRLGLGSTPSVLLMQPLLTYAATSQPPPRITLLRGSPEELTEALRQRRLDVLVMEMRSVPPKSDLSLEPIAALRLGILARPQHPLLQRQQPLTLRDLEKYPLSCTPFSDELARLWVQIMGDEVHPNDLVTLVCDDIASMLHASSQSDALFLGVLATARDQLDAGKLVQLPFDLKGMKSQFGLLRLARHTQPPAFLPLKKLIVERFRDM